jgi:CARDB
MLRFLSARASGRWTLVAGMLFAIAGTAHAQGVRGSIVGPRPTLLQLAYGPDLTVTATPVWCDRVSFTATLSPGSSASPGVLVPVKVRVFDKIFGVSTAVGELVFMVPATGGSVSSAIEWPMPADARFQPDFTNEITVVVDPDNAVEERYESNNVATVWGTCVG